MPRIGDDDSKENSKHQHEGTMIKIYSAWKGVATTVRVRLRRTSRCAETCKCAEFLLQQDIGFDPGSCETVRAVVSRTSHTFLYSLGTRPIAEKEGLVNGAGRSVHCEC